MLQRKHFNELAKAFQSVRFQDSRERESALWTLCTILAQTNPGFNRIRFINAATCMPDVEAQ